jgi:REP element-mobilizing transposase RayT
MARPPRIEVPGGFFHVASRGNDRAEIYRTDDDRKLFTRLLLATAQQMTWTLHAYCLMTNHFHLVVETPLPNLARGMQRLNGRYGQLFNERHERSGHLFQGRYWSALIEDDDRFAETCRYVLLNPVRAGLSEFAHDWPWSGGTLLLNGSFPDLSGV